jgi:excisionase family DNA binding protein
MGIGAIEDVGPEGPSAERSGGTAPDLRWLASVERRRAGDLRTAADEADSVAARLDEIAEAGGCRPGPARADDRQAAELLGTSHAAIASLCNSGDLAHGKTEGGHRRISRAEVTRYAESLSRRPRPVEAPRLAS